MRPLETRDHTVATAQPGDDKRPQYEDLAG